MVRSQHGRGWWWLRTSLSTFLQVTWHVVGMVEAVVAIDIVVEAAGGGGGRGYRC